PPPSLPAWAESLAWTDLPVLRASALAVQARSRQADETDAHVLAEIVLRDPLLCLRVLAAAVARQSRLATPVETVAAALVLTGIDPFFRDCAGMRVLEDALEGPARQRALAVIARSHVAARIAAAFAIHRQDEDVEAVHLAALLHDFAQLLAPYFAPQAEEQADDDAAPQEEVTDALLQRWGLPETLRTLAREPAGEAAGPRMVALAVRIAQHLEHGWHGPALLEDFTRAAALLNLKLQAATALVRQAAD
ncbi:MAG: HDOD domain-containing protein, partial [Comamonadaceae bacterium]